MNETGTLKMFWSWCSMVLLPLTLMTSGLAAAGAGEMVCFSLLEEPSQIYYSDVDNSNLFVRSSAPPLCSSESGAVELDSCRVCVEDEQFITKCKLSRPSAHINCEGEGKTLSKTQIKCGADVVTSAVGQDCLLPCFTDRPQEVIVVEWTVPERDVYVLVHRAGRILEKTQHSQYRNRIQLLDPQLHSGDLSVVLENVTHEDSGTYRCRKVYENRQLISQFIHLRVTDPDCSIRTTAEPTPGHSLVPIPGLVTGVTALILLFIVIIIALHAFIKRSKVKGQLRHLAVPQSNDANSSPIKTSPNLPDATFTEFLILKPRPLSSPEFSASLRDEL